MVLLWFVVFRMIRPSQSNGLSPAAEYAEKPAGNSLRTTTIGLYGVLVLMLFQALPPTGIGRLIYHGDFPYQYYVTLRNIEQLKSGSLYAWEPNFLGGYPSFLDFSKDLSPLMLPLEWCFSGPVAFQLLVYLAMLGLPWAFMFWASAFSDTRRQAYLATQIFIIFMVVNGRSFLNGMVTALYGQMLFFICSASFHLIARQKRMNVLIVSFLCSLLLIHIHGSFFMFSMMFMLFDLIVLWSADRTRFVRLWFFACVGVAIAPYAVMHLSLRQTAIASSKLLEEGLYHSFSRFVLDLSQPYLWSEWGITGFLLLLLLPCLALRDRPNALSFILWNALFFLMLAPLKTASFIGFAVSRHDYVLGPLACVLGGFWLARLGLKRMVTVGSALVLFMFQTFMPFPQRLESRDPDFFQPLLHLIELSGEGRVLAENAARWNALPPDQRSEQAKLPHYVPYVQMLSGKPFLSNPGADAYHYSRYRFNTITSGTFRGKPLDLFSASEMNDHCLKWKVRTIIVWSRAAITYFTRFPEYFDTVGQWQEFTVFRVSGMDYQPGPRIVGSGLVKEVVLDDWTRNISVNDAAAGSTIVLDQNYSPLWRATIGDRPLETLDREGQLALRIPGPGLSEIVLTFPDFRLLFIACFLVSCCTIIVLVVLKKTPPDKM